MYILYGWYKCLNIVVHYTQLVVGDASFYYG